MPARLEGVGGVGSVGAATDCRVFVLVLGSLRNIDMDGSSQWSCMRVGRADGYKLLFGRDKGASRCSGVTLEALALAQLLG